MLFNHNLGLETEKEVNGPSSQYAGQMAAIGDDFFISHIHSGQLYFDDELILPYTGSGQKPYIAGIGEQAVTGISIEPHTKTDLVIYPNPATEWISLSYADNIYGYGSFKLINLNGDICLTGNFSRNLKRIDVSSLPEGLYFFQVNVLNESTNAQISAAGKLVLMK
jgi:hypothetical protein